MQAERWPDAFLGRVHASVVARLTPCVLCGERCESQLEGSTGNGGQPYATCSGCMDKWHMTSFPVLVVAPPECGFLPQHVIDQAQRIAMEEP